MNENYRVIATNRRVNSFLNVSSLPPEIRSRPFATKIMAWSWLRDLGLHDLYENVKIEASNAA